MNIDDDAVRYPIEKVRGSGQRRRSMPDISEQAGRVPPQATEVEQSVLGAMLIEPEAIPQALDILKPDAFYQPKHRRIYQAVINLFERGNPVDLITLTEELKRIGELDTVGGPYYLSELTAKVATAANVEYHARIIAEKALLRKMIETMTMVIGQAYDPSSDAFDLLDHAERSIFEISESNLRRGAIPMKDVMMETVERLQAIHGREGGITGIPSGFRQLDDLTGGWQPGDMIILAARPSMGKCVAHDTEILQADGRLVPIETLFRRKTAHLLTLRSDGTFGLTRPSAFVDDGHKPVFRVRTRLGRAVETTLTHPFLTNDGWKPLGDLTVGDAVAVPRRLPVFGTKPMPEHEVEGLAAHGIRGETVHDRQIPAPVFTLPKPQLALFLNRLFGADGRAWVLDGGQGRIEYCPASEKLARQLQHLLLRFGVLARVRADRARDRDTHRPVWQLDITEEASIETFVDEIGLAGKEDAVAQVWEAVASKRYRTARELIPVGVWDEPDEAEGPELHRPPAENDVYWDEIVAIEPMGRKQVYDLTIPETHNFVAADVCVHNTAFCLDVARNAVFNSYHPVPVVVFSLEMSSGQLAQRLLTSEARVDAQAARTGRLREEDWPRLARAAGKLSSASIFVDDTPGLGILELRTKCRRLKAEHDIGLVVVDYLQLMQGVKGAQSREQEIASISRSLKSIAKELNVPVIALSQLNRAVETRGGDKRPMISDLRESGSIEQDADVVMFIYRAERYGITVDENGNSTEGMAEIIVGKQRNGPIGRIQLAFVNKYARFENLTTYYAPPPGTGGDGFEPLPPGSPDGSSPTESPF